MENMKKENSRFFGPVQAIMQTVNSTEDCAVLVITSERVNSEQCAVMSGANGKRRQIVDALVQSFCEQESFMSMCAEAMLQAKIKLSIDERVKEGVEEELKKRAKKSMEEACTSSHRHEDVGVNPLPESEK